MEHLDNDAGLNVVMVVTNPVRPDRPDPRVYREAQALVDEGHRVTVLAWDRQGEYAPMDLLGGVLVERIRTPARYGSGSGLILPLLHLRREISRRLDGRHCDVLHVHDLDGLVAGYPFARRHKCHLVFDAHESYPEYVAPRVPRAVVFLARVIERVLVRRVDAVVTVGEMLVEKYIRLGVSRVVLVGNWHDPSTTALTDKEKEGIRSSLGVHGLMVSYVGGFGRNRALLELVEAVRGFSDVTLVLAGTGSQRPQVEARIAGDSRIVDLGVVPYARALEIRAASDVVYRAARVEGTPNAQYSAPNGLFEALAAGVPIIASSNGDLGRIVREERCGIVLSEVTASTVAAAIQTMQDDGTRSSMSKNASAAAYRIYNWQEARRRITQLYAQLAEERKNGSTCTSTTHR